jgi:hypothetical protein
MKTDDYKAGEQNIYAYQAAHPWATLRYAVKVLLRRA